METIKKFGKELGVFGVVIVAFIGLFIYSRLVTAEFTTLTIAKAQAKFDKQDTFVLVTGDQTLSSTANYQEVMVEYLKDNRGEKLYYIDLASNDDAQTFAGKYLGETTIDTQNPHTYYVKDGKVVKEKETSLGYYDFTEFMKSTKK